MRMCRIAEGLDALTAKHRGLLLSDEYQKMPKYATKRLRLLFYYAATKKPSEKHGEERTSDSATAAVAAVGSSSSAMAAAGEV